MGGPPTVCDDMDACTTDSCDPAIGCTTKPVESTACGNCDDCLDNDMDNNGDIEDPDCDGVPALQRFAVTATFPSGKPPLYLGSDVNIDSVNGMCPNSPNPFPGGMSRGGVCGHDMAIRAGGTMGILATQQTTVLQKGVVFGQGITGERDISIRSEFVSNGMPETIKSQPPFVGPGECSNNALQICTSNADCSGPMVLCIGRERLTAPGNPYVDRTGTADNFDRCVAALGSLASTSAQVAMLPGNVAGFTSGNTDIRTNAKTKVLTINLGSGLQVINARRVQITGNSEVRFVGQPDTILIIRVGRQLRMGGNAKIVLQGGLTPNRVLWNVEGAKQSISLNRASEFRGTILAAQRKRIRIGGSVLIEGAIFGQRVHVNLATRIVHYPFTGTLP